MFRRRSRRLHKRRFETAEGKSDEGIASLRRPTTEFSDYFDAYLAIASNSTGSGKIAMPSRHWSGPRQINDKEPWPIHVWNGHGPAAEIPCSRVRLAGLPS